MSKLIGILTSGGDCPGLNAAIRGVGKAGRESYQMRFLGFLDGFRGLVQDRHIELNDALLSGILTNGGTILGTSRDKPHRMSIGGKLQDMTDVIVENYHRHHLDALVCLGGGGTLKNAKHLADAGLRVLTLPKTIDNDVAGTDVTFGFNTALGIATDAIDRLHSTATSHSRVIVVEIMGHRAGWLALGAGIAGGADVVLIPEIPYDIDVVAEAIRKRNRNGKRFSIVAVAEGAMSRSEKQIIDQLLMEKNSAKGKEEKNKVRLKLESFHSGHVNHTVTLTAELEKLTGQETRLTILGHLQRGGTPSAADRLLATGFGTACADALQRGDSGVMIALRGDQYVPVPLAEVYGRKKLVSLDHPWVETALKMGVCLGAADL